ncbi:predicted protein [Postia placenta Mad-698-R]|nr:predicted protein [Postia placenta Mad-698-R]
MSRDLRARHRDDRAELRVSVAHRRRCRRASKAKSKCWETESKCRAGCECQKEVYRGPAGLGAYQRRMRVVVDNVFLEEIINEAKERKEKERQTKAVPIPPPRGANPEPPTSPIAGPSRPRPDTPVVFRKVDPDWTPDTTQWTWDSSWPHQKHLSGEEWMNVGRNARKEWFDEEKDDGVDWELYGDGEHGGKEPGREGGIHHASPKSLVMTLLPLASARPKTTGSTCLSPHRLRTLKFWRYLEEQGDTSARIKDVLAYMLSKSIDLPILLRLLSWGAEELIDDPFVHFEWTALMGSLELGKCLDEWYLPNRSHERGLKMQGVHQTLTHWATSCVGDMVTKEMVKIGKVLHSEPEELSEETLLAVKWESLTNTTKQEAPVLWQLLCLCQKLIAIYLKSCGTSAKVFDTLHVLGVTMSQKWTYNGLEKLSQHACKSLLADIENFLILGAHDNVNIAYCVYEQRSDHQSHFDSGTAGTIFVIKDPEAPRLDSHAYRAQCAIGSQDPITPELIHKLEMKAAPHLGRLSRYSILQSLLEAPEFAYNTYEHHSNSLFDPPPRPGQLPTGPEHKITQYMLDTVHIQEVSYEGNKRVMSEWRCQLGWNTSDAEKNLGLERLIPWVGDQLTASRLCGITKFRCQD